MGGGAEPAQCRFFSPWQADHLMHLAILTCFVAGTSGRTLVMGFLLKVDENFSGGIPGE